jgi:hypothetical protein
MPDTNLFAITQLCLTDDTTMGARFDDGALYVTFLSGDTRIRLTISGTPERIYGLASDLMNHALDCGARPGGVDAAFERQGRHTQRALVAAAAKARENAIAAGKATRDRLAAAEALAELANDA